ADVPGSWLRRNTPLQGVTLARIDKGVASGLLSLRGYDRILRLAWSIADLAGHGRPTDDDVAAAFMLSGRMDS
ncbi:UNVERIFIED_CONTAM: ATP-binding protein, partial [Bacillus subtilis]